MKIIITKFNNPNSANYFDNRINFSFGGDYDFLFDLHLFQLNYTPLEAYAFYIKWEQTSSYHFKVSIIYRNWVVGELMPVYTILDSIDLTGLVSGKLYKINLKDSNWNICGSILLKYYDIMHILETQMSGITPFNEENILTNVSKRDSIELTKLPKDFLQEFNEKLIDDFNYQFKVGVVNLKLFYNRGESSEQGKNLMQFFEDYQPGDIFRILIIENNVFRTGFIDFESLDLWKKRAAAGEVSFDVYPPETELCNLQILFSKINGIYSINFANIQFTYLEFLNLCGKIFGLNILDLTSFNQDFYNRNGFYPYLETPYLYGYPYIGRLGGFYSYFLEQKNYSASEFFFELLRGLGFYWNIFVSENSNFHKYFPFNMALNIRENGDIIENYKIMKEGINKSYRNNSYSFIGFVFTKNSYVNENGGTTDYDCCLITNGDVTYYGDIYEESEEMYRMETVYPYQFSKRKFFYKDSIYWINQKYFDINYRYPENGVGNIIKQMSPLAIFTPQLAELYTTPDMVKMIDFIKDRYLYFIKDNLERYEVIIRVPNIFDLTKFNKLSFLNKYFQIEEIKRFNIKRKIAAVRIAEDNQ